MSDQTWTQGYARHLPTEKVSSNMLASQYGLPPRRLLELLPKQTIGCGINRNQWIQSNNTNNLMVLWIFFSHQTDEMRK